MKNHSIEYSKVTAQQQVTPIAKLSTKFFVNSSDFSIT